MSAIIKFEFVFVYPYCYVCFHRVWFCFCLSVLLCLLLSSLSLFLFNHACCYVCYYQVWVCSCWPILSHLPFLKLGFVFVHPHCRISHLLVCSCWYWPKWLAWHFCLSLCLPACLSLLLCGTHPCCLVPVLVGWRESFTFLLWQLTCLLSSFPAASKGLLWQKRCQSQS